MTLTHAQPDSMAFCYTVDRDGERMTLTVTSRINALNAVPIRQRALQEIADGARWITIDLAACDAIEKRHFGDLLSIAQHARRAGGAVTVLDANPQVYRAFHDWGVASAFTFATSEVAE